MLDRRVSHLSAIFALCMIASACLPHRVSQLLGLPQTLTLTGKVVTPSGGAASDVLVFVGQSSEAKATTDAEGRYTVLLNEGDLMRLRGAETQRETFQLFFQKDLPEVQVAASMPIEQAARGTRTLAESKLDAPASFKGLVQVLGKGRKLESAMDAVVRVGRYEAKTAADGTFELSGLPSGRLTLTVSARSFASFHQDINLQAGQTDISAEPFVLFEEPGIAGALIPRPDASLVGERVDAGHPYLQSFFVRGSSAGRFLRMTAKEEELEGAKWIAVANTVDFDFPSAGGHKLFYQFADAEKKNLSPVYQISVVINLFADSKGVTINDGSGLANSAQVVVNVDVPRAAYRMRYAETPQELISAPWGEARTKFLYVFDSRTATDSEKSFMRNFYVQFEDATGAASLVFSTTVLLDLFPAVDFTIGDGSGMIATRLTTVSLRLPPSAVEMRLADDYNKISESPWQKAVPDSTYLFSARLDLNTQFFMAGGPRTLKVQFRDAARFTSPVYERPVYLNLFPDQGPVFTVNFGSLETSNRIVTLQINVPPNAAEMRIYDPLGQTFDPLIGLDILDLLGIGIFPRGPNVIPWLRAQPVSYYYIPFLDVVGERLINLQFRDLDGIVSPIYTQPVIFNPFPADVAMGARITGGTGQLLDVELAPPPLTTEYRIFDTASVPDNLPWKDYRDNNNVTNNHVQFVTTTTSGPVILTVQYKVEGSNAVATVLTNAVNVPLP